MYSKILVPLDGMELAECILGHVREIVTGCQSSEVILLTVVEPYEKGLPNTTWGGVISAEQEAALAIESRAKAKDYITEVADKLREEGIFVQPVVIQGKVAEGILDYAIENFQSAEVLLNSELYNPCLQNVQQSVEKALKSILIENNNGQLSGRSERYFMVYINQSETLNLKSKFNKNDLVRVILFFLVS